MKLFDIVGGKVIIHSDALGIPCFKKIWDSFSNEEATKYISYIVLKNKYDSPYVLAYRTEDIEGILKKELFKDSSYKLPKDIIECEDSYKRFCHTLIHGLLINSRKKLESVSKYYEESLDDILDDKKVKDIYGGMEKMANTVSALDRLEKAVRSEELSLSKVRGGAEINPFELPKQQVV